MSPPGLWWLYSDQCRCPDWWCAWSVWALWRSAGWRRKVWFFFFYATTKCNYVHETGDFNMWFHLNLFPIHNVTVCIASQIQLLQRLPEGQDLHHHPKGWCGAVHGGNGTLTARCHHDCAQSNQGGESFISCYKWLQLLIYFIFDFQCFLWAKTDNFVYNV